MADSSSLLQSIISGVISGGGSATTAVLAVFRDIKKRLKALEEKLGNDGSNGSPKTGMFAAIERLEELTRKMKKDLSQWEEDPPEWLVRMVNRAARSTSVNMEQFGEIERLIEQRARTTNASLARLESMIESLEKRLDNYIEKAEYESDARERSEELSKLREHLASANGLLRGIMTAMGYVDPSKKRP
jgi:chromosome segregation ATPase